MHIITSKIKECLNKVTCIHHKETTESQPKNQIQYVVPDEIVSYGLGNFAECLIARYQLAVLVALRDDLQVPQNSVLLYDPKFLSVEKDVLTSFGFQVLKENEEAKRCCERPTLFYMPHCGKACTTTCCLLTGVLIDCVTLSS
nr:SRR1-like protein [Crassostrea gigas]